ncbi:MAG: tyrosine-type recombinase/integrase [Ilumatobacteraceae bacterium]
MAVGGRPIVQDDGKTAAAYRVVPLDQRTCTLLQERREAQQLEYERLGLPQERRSDFVFTNVAGGHLDPRSFARSFEYLCELAGVRRIHVHDVRHTFATRMLRHVQTYGQLLALSRMLGHSSVTVTLELYGHAADGEAGLLHAAMMESHRNRTSGGSAAALAPDDSDSRQPLRLVGDRPA